MAQQLTTTESRMAGTKLAPLEYKRIAELVDIGMYLSVSDFLREAIRDKLEAIQVVKARDVDYRTAEKEVLGYYKNYREAYPHEVADDLELDYELVCKIIDKLKKSKRLEVIE